MNISLNQTVEHLKSLMASVKDYVFPDYSEIRTENAASNIAGRIEAEARLFAETEASEAAEELVGAKIHGRLRRPDVAGMHDDFRDGEVFVAVGVVELRGRPVAVFAEEDGVPVDDAFRNAA